MLSADRNRILYDGWVLEPISPEALLLDFDCGKDDLNSFYKDDLWQHEEELITKSYVFCPEGAGVRDAEPPAAFISYCNDAVLKARFTRGEWKKVVKEVPFRKRYSALPAVKIARLGVQTRYKRKGVGSALLNLTKLLFLTNNRTGCRFITVDAYNTEEAVGMYTKNYFAFMTETDQDNETRIMYYDLTRSLTQTSASTFLTVS
ncbi:MAG: GNAT family N-acetyltransferase [Pseudomonadota bacterium]